ncbi:MAG TPA: DUF2231 domain-containing protein [Syntrophorhabdaceae bacterium]
MKEFLPAELAELDGRDGKPAHIAHDGKVYDVSGSGLWPKGVHMMRHHAGADLSADIGAAPHGPEVLERYPFVGTLKKEEDRGGRVPPGLLRLLLRFPFLKRHPHPMTVHFPIVFMFSAAAFTILHLVTGSRGFDATALNCLGAGILLTPVAMATGYYTWWLNYMAKPMRTVSLKKRLSLLLFILNIVIFIWRMSVPDILLFRSYWTFLYLLLMVSLVPLVIILGWLGATLTFPVEKK